MVLLAVRRVCSVFPSAGLLLGQGGTHQKLLESKTGCKILLRGQGTARPGDAPTPEDNDPLHVVIVGGSDEAISQAEQYVKDIFTNKSQAQIVREAGGSDFNPSGAGSGSNAMPLGGSGGPGLGSQIMQGLAQVPPGGTQEQITVATAHVGLIIGRGGERISQLESESQARIQLQRDSDVPPGAPTRLCVVTGLPHQVAQAKASIEALLASEAQQASSGGGAGGQASASISVPDGSVGMIIGRGGSNVNEIQSRTSTHVEIPKFCDPSTPGMRTVVITGASQQQCDTARSDIENMLAAEARGERPQLGGSGGAAAGAGANIGPPAEGHWNGSEYICELDVPNDRIGPVIGRQGSNIKDVQMRTGTYINIREHADHLGQRRITVRGQNAESAEAAKVEIMSKAANTRPLGGGNGPTGANAFPAGGGYDATAAYQQQGGGGFAAYAQQQAYSMTAGAQQQAYGQQAAAYGAQGMYGQQAYGQPAQAYGAQAYGAQAYGTAQQAYGQQAYGAAQQGQQQAYGAAAAAAPAPAAAATGNDEETKAAWIAYYKQFGYEWDEATQSWKAPGAADGAAASGGAASTADASAAAAAITTASAEATAPAGDATATSDEATATADAPAAAGEAAPAAPAAPAAAPEATEASAAQVEATAAPEAQAEEADAKNATSTEEPVEEGVGVTEASETAE